MKLSFARKEDEALLFTASSSSSSFPKDGGGNILAIGLCDVAGAGVRALKSLTISRESGGKHKLKRRDFELKFTDENGGDLVGKMVGNKNGEKEADEEEEEEEEEDDISALERAIFVKTSDDGEALDDAPAVSLVQFTDEENNAVVLSCLAINVMVPEPRDGTGTRRSERVSRSGEVCERAFRKLRSEDCFLRGDEARARGDARRRGERCLLFR